jgi:predicted enzyme related to lactoylglutathione lyase
MGPDLPANNTWKIYLTTGEITATAQAIERESGQITAPVMPVADLGSQLVFDDPAGANLGAWQPGTFPGFTVLEEPGAPSWFELHTRDYRQAVEFYRTVFGLETVVAADSDEFRYTTLCSAGSATEVAGIMDAAAFLPEGVPSHWGIYWEVADADAACATTRELGGSVVDQPVDTPHGRMATVTDPAGAQFRLRTGPK